MNGQNKKMELLGTAPIPKALLAMGIPTMIGMLVNALYNLVDAYFVSGLGESQMGAISVVYPLGQVIVGLGLLFGNGAASYISRLLGSGNLEKANKIASTALYSSLFAGALVIALSVVFLHPILKLLGATPGILPYAATYAGIYLISCIFNVFNVTMNNIVTSEGAAKITMCALLLGAVLNIGLDPLFIYTLDLGIAGAAIATAISQILSTSVYLLYMFRKKSVFLFKIKDCTYSKEIMSQIFKIGIPTLVFQVLTSLSISFINNAAGNYSDAVIAAMGVVTRLVSIGSLTVFGFIKGFQPIAGYSYGARKFDRLHKSIRTSILWSTIFCVVLGLVLILFSTSILTQFTTGNVEMVAVGAKALRANGITFMLFGFYTVYSSLFLALGKGKEGFILGACRQGLCFIPVVLILPLFWGINGILYAQPIADVLSAVIAVFMAVHLHRRLEVC
ncbi:MATE family efflux transporter [Ihubacter massiliensis]|uniref:Multidrug export protein MepA n=1 Tax=Hominibacterium faecale TaxID=2839743 RepID=A0A9J6QVE8_9FIRM|nr:MULTISPECIES: MATE family efflux transporter [Eubacteriales Family XIII. Incertae Sedis]MCO7121122.1 MATE family efflux transporter [Ihubacter massiliensis]MCU7378038.1 MATE family efflux transporter [Hominibacterium faecale]MDE8732690.1 MATE family efflux transporter [Eubacteriales bacterium DFI.9.88]